MAGPLWLLSRASIHRLGGQGRGTGPGGEGTASRTSRGDILGVGSRGFPGFLVPPFVSELVFANAGYDSAVAQACQANVRFLGGIRDGLAGVGLPPAPRDGFRLGGRNDEKKRGNDGKGWVGMRGVRIGYVWKAPCFKLMTSDVRVTSISIHSQAESALFLP